MNPIPFNHKQATALALPDSGQIVQQGIAHNDMTRLQQMVHAGEVDGHTLTAEQRTLLIEAVRCLNINAFALCFWIPMRPRTPTRRAATTRRATSMKRCPMMRSTSISRT
jgi:hypothetical protein